MGNWSQQELGLALSALNNLLTAIAIFVPIILYRRSRKRKLRILSALTLNNGAVVATIRATNMEAPRIGVENIALSLRVWDTRPRLQVTFLRILRLLEGLVDVGAYEKYASDAGLICVSPPLSASLSEHESVEAIISLDATMEEFFKQGGVLGSIFFFDLLMLLLRVEIVTPAGIQSRRAHREIRYYLWKRYRNDPRLLGAAT